MDISNTGQSIKSLVDQQPTTSPPKITKFPNTTKLRHFSQKIPTFAIPLKAQN